jgi:NADH-quinone oxidoreductase subunit H
VLCVILFFMLVRWTWLRFRFDQLMALAWKVMLPLGLVNFVTIAALDQLRFVLDPDASDVFWDWMLALPAWVVGVGAWVLVSLLGPLVADNRPRRDIQPYEFDSRT